MPISYAIDVPNRVVNTVCSGAITLQEMKRVAGEIRDDPQFQADYGQIIDLTGVEELKLTFRDVYSFRHNCDPFSGRSQRAVAAPSDAAYGMARMYAELLNNPQFAVFRSLDRARQWLK